MDIYVYTILSDDNVVEVGRYRSNAIPRAGERISLYLDAHGTTWRVEDDGVLYALDKESVALTVSPVGKEAQAYCKRLSERVQA